MLDRIAYRPPQRDVATARRVPQSERGGRCRISRVAFLERLHHALDSPETPSEEPDAVNRLRDALVAEHGSALKRILTRPGQDSVLVVVSLPPERIAEEEVRLAAMSDLPVNLIDQATHEIMLRLAKSGFVSLPSLTTSALVPDRQLCSFHPARYGSDPPRW